jgi:hypothetical protein
MFAETEVLYPHIFESPEFQQASLELAIRMSYQLRILEESRRIHIVLELP